MHLHFAATPPARAPGPTATTLTALSQSPLGEVAQLFQAVRTPAVQQAVVALLRALAAETLEAAPLPMAPLPPPPEPPPTPPASQDAELTEQLHADLLARQSGLSLHWQPVVASGSGALLGFEALLRWTTPRGQQVPAAHLVQLATRARLLETLDFWVTQQAVSQARPWLAANPRLIIAINVTAALLSSPLAVNAVRALLRAHAVKAANFCLEVAEPTLRDPLVAANLAALRRLGLLIAVDDIGAAPGAPAWLDQLPVDVVKLDRDGFLGQRDNQPDPERIAAVSELARQARALGRLLVAKGVASRQDAALAQRLGCDACQGYWFAGPLSAGAAGSLARAGLGELPWQQHGAAA